MNAGGHKTKRINTSHIGGRHRFSACANEPVENKKMVRSDVENLRNICKEKCDTVLVVLAERASTNRIVRKTLQTAVDWVGVDDKNRRIEGEYKKIPFGFMCAIITVAISLLLIVAGNVMVSQASMELWSLEEKYEDLKEYEVEMESRLALKNDLRYIEYVARTELGMVDREHADVIYIGDEPQNRVETYDVDDDDHIGLSTLLYSLGLIK